jgi:glycine dehydrogenase subunit 2
MREPLIFDLSVPGRTGASLPSLDVPEKGRGDVLPDSLLRTEPAELPEMSEPEVVRHFVRLSTLNFHVDKGFYPLGSCTMKYNPKVNEDMAELPGFTGIHPLQEPEDVQGALALMKELEELLAELSGTCSVTLQPAAGAHGELTGMLMVRKYHLLNGQTDRRKYILIPDSAHGTNPASVVTSGFEPMGTKSDGRGLIDLESLKANLSEEVAAFMVTNPNTLGLFEENICEAARLVHEAGALMYMDGANLNAFMGHARPGDMGFDIVHFNLHKTFSTPHGGGGPGSGPVGVVEKLVPLLPSPRIVERDGVLLWDDDRPDSIGKVHSFFGNFGVLVKAYTYIRMLGAEGLRDVSRDAVINANYLRARLESHYELPYKGICMHECVLSGRGLKEHGVRTLDVAKRLLDYGFHAPTIYFPLIVPEALMIEPTETETKETLDAFADALIRIAEEARENPEILHEAPVSTPVRRLDDAKAARDPDLRWRPGGRT